MAEPEMEASATAPIEAAAPAEYGPNHDAYGELPPYDEALLVRIKGRVKKPMKPDDTERNITIEKMSAEVKKLGDRIAEIKALEMARRTRGANPEVDEHRKKKQLLNGEWQAVLKQKMLIREEFQRAQTEKEVLRNDLREIRGKIPRGTRLDTLESEVQAIEFRMEHDSISAAEEKKVQQQLANLISARPMARQVISLEEKLKSVEERRGSAKARLDHCDAVLSGIKEKEQIEVAALDEIHRGREDANVDFPAMQVEKQEAWEVIQALKAKMGEVRDNYNKQYLEWSVLNKNYNAWSRHDKKAQYEDRQKQREQRDADRDGDEQAATGTAPSEPYESEIFTIDQLLTYLRKFLAAEEVVVKAQEVKEVVVPQGLKAYVKKEEDFSFFTSIKKGAKGGKGGKGGASQDKSAAAPSESKRKINHSLEILKTFMSFGLDVPHNTSELAGTFQKVEAKRLDFLEKRKQAKEAPPSSSRNKTQELPANGNHVAEEEEVEAPKAEEEEEELVKEEEPVKDVSEAEEADVEAPQAVEDPVQVEEPVTLAPEAEEPAEMAVEAAAEAGTSTGCLDVTLRVDEASRAVSLSIKVAA